ncbi:MAG TPA: hypothetical protein VMY36_04120 [Patescibacteria group bacterium]|nr:hypothetical protein [Patescibacteria group bacterium]
MAYSEIFPGKEKRLPTALAVGFDLDDFIFDLAEPSLEVLNQRYGTNFQKADIRDFWYIRAFLEEIGLPEEEIVAFHEELYFSPDRHRVYEKSPVIPGAVEMLNGVYRFHRPFIVTSRPPGLEETTARQLETAGINWVKGDWANGGHLLIRDEYYWQTMTGEEFKLRAASGSFTNGKYKDFPGLNAHFDDMGLLLDHPLAADIKNKIFILFYKYNQGVPQENLVYNLWNCYKVVRCLARGESLDQLMSHINQSMSHNIDRSSRLV